MGGSVNQEESKKVEEKVCQIIAESLCVEPEQVNPSANLMKDLGAESIDFLDILFRLEKEFNIKIPQREIERMARGGLEPEEFEKDGVLQPKGIVRLRELLPEIPSEHFYDGMPLRELPGLFTVGVFASIVKRKLSGTLIIPGMEADKTTEVGC